MIMIMIFKKTKTKKERELKVYGDRCFEYTTTSKYHLQKENGRIVDRRHSNFSLKKIIMVVFFLLQAELTMLWS